MQYSHIYKKIKYDIALHFAQSGKRGKHMNIKKLSAVILIITVTLSLIMCMTSADTDENEVKNDLPSTESTQTEDRILSPGLKNIASRCRLKVSGAAGMSIGFSEEDFLRAMNLNEIGSIKINSLPEPTEGELLFMGENVTVGQMIDRSQISSLEFIPSGSHVTSSSFKFSEGSAQYELTGEIYILDKANSSPSVREISVGKYVSAYTDISYKGHLSGYDPDGDPIEYMIVKYPQNGIIILNTAHGEYEYHPNEGFTGKDTFKYVIIDGYGAYSAAETVVVNVESINADEKYTDMDSSKSYVEAIALSRSGILGGRDVGGKLMFLPNEKITRGEFISIIMNACEIELKDTTVRTVFADDGDIHKSIKPAVAAAYELGYIDPIAENEKLYFRPNDQITVAECASIINRILSIDTEMSIPVSSVIEDCPEDSYLAVSSLCSVSILPHDEGVIDASEPLTREYAAKIVYNVNTFLNLHKSH